MKARRILLLPLLGAALLLNLAGCPDPQSQGNLPPTASFWDFEVTGAGTAAVNGGYNLDGTWPTSTPQRQYTKTDGNCFLFAFWDDGYSARYWSINSTLQDGVAPTTLAYYNISTSNQPAPPSSSWTVGTADNPAPTVARRAIQGDTSTTGKLLTAQFEYSDPDNDLEGSSVYKWYRFETESETDITAGTLLATSKDYTTVLADANKYLRVQVTPVDVLGNRGDPVLSGPSFKIGGGT